MATVYVAAFRPNREDGGVGGFNWHPDRATARAIFERNIAEFDSGTEHAFWSHETELTEQNAITDEIDLIEWGWIPEDRKHTATIWAK